MSRHILGLKSIKINPDKVQTMAAKRLAKLKGFDLKEEYFEPVYHPADLVEHIAYYAEGETYNTNVRFLTSRVQPIQAITATTGWI